jgi:uncharacterized protein involved in type VI secretion and phage assembly
MIGPEPHPDTFDGGVPGKRYFGLYPAIVTNVVDPKQMGRIEVRFPWMGEAGSTVRAWARLVTLYADNDQGWEILPAKDSEVIVGFEAGNIDRAYIVGAVWNGKEALPQAAEEANNKRLLKTRAGSVFEFDDTEGAAKVTLSMKTGHKLVFEEQPQRVTLHHANGCELVMEMSGTVQIKANATVEINASALNVHAPTATFDGSVICKTLTASVAVNSPMYSQGAGNVW